jgi:GNAT superfamily N-acetyltransferase
VLLTKNLLTEFVGFLFQECSDNDKNQKTAELYNQLFSKESAYLFYEISETHSEAVSLILEKFDSQSYFLYFGPIKCDDLGKSKTVSILLGQAVEFLNKQPKCVRVEFRCDTGYGWSNLLKQHGFILAHEREEFQYDLLQEFSVPDSPIAFCDYLSAGLDLPTVAELMDRATIGDPAHVDGEKAIDALQYFISDKKKYSEPDCIQVGLVNEVPIAIVIPQSVGNWGSITWMGVIPEARGKGYGKILQLHGMQCLKQQGATFYHGGTLVNNAAMIKLFKKNGCKIFKKLQVWNLNT